MELALRPLSLPSPDCRAFSAETRTFDVFRNLALRWGLKSKPIAQGKLSRRGSRSFLAAPPGKSISSTL
jgi:hypothetical protein